MSDRSSSKCITLVTREESDLFSLLEQQEQDKKFWLCNLYVTRN